MKAIVLTGQLTSFSSRADKSLGFRGCTPELTSAEKAALMDFQDLNVRMLIEPIDYPSDGKMEVKSQFESKTPSERLRGVLFVAWKQGGEKGVFADFYRDRMNAYIEDVKSYLKPD
jgi:hypothetical protein